MTITPDIESTRPAGGAPAIVVAGPGEALALRELIDWSRDHSSRLGYFAALYFHVGRAVEHALDRGQFEHPDALRRLNEAFFDRYKAAFVAFCDGRPSTAAWEASFRAAANDDLIAMQHLMLGVNAHINFDLAIAVSDSIPPAELPAFRADFEVMNAILATLVNGMAADLATVFHPLRIINWLFRREDDLIVEFSMRVAREHAWMNVMRLSQSTAEQRAELIADMQREAMAMAAIVIETRWPVRLLVRWIRRRERGNVAQIIDILMQR